jgi:2-polyprenyl-3-methyl-5-hydroxy-6-metoxy-1,4-benzoquinol methylase
MKFSSDTNSGVPQACPCCGGFHFRFWMQSPGQFDPNGMLYELLRCDDCSHTWIGKPPSPEELSSYYGPEYHESVGTMGEKTTWRWRRQLEVIARFKTSGAILDIGCSSGGFLAYLRGGAWRLFGIEASEETAEKARLTTGGTIIPGDVLDADLEPNTFDVVTCSDVLEHLYEPRAVFGRVSKWLKPGGIFYIFVPNIASWESRAFGASWSGLDLPRHLHHYSIQSLKVMADSAGLRIASVDTPAGCYLEQSWSVWLNARLRKAGVSNPRVDLSGPAWIGWRALRKGFRLTVENAYSHLSAACGAAPSLRAVFQKPADITPAIAVRPGSPDSASLQPVRDDDHAALQSR